MIRIPSPVEGVIIERDLRNDVWQLCVSGEQFRLRPWTWGGRRRILECATASGQFDRVALIEGLFDLLLEPQPPPDHVSDLACACLYLLKAGADLDLSRAEYLAFTDLGLQPAELDLQPAAAVDRLLAQLPQAEPPASEESGWTRINFRQADPEALPATAPAARLDDFLQRIAKAAGFSQSATPPEPQGRARHTAPFASSTDVPPEQSPLRKKAAAEPTRENATAAAIPATESPTGVPALPSSSTNIRADAPETRSTPSAMPVFRLRKRTASSEPALRAVTDSSAFRGTARLVPVVPRLSSSPDRAVPAARSRSWRDNAVTAVVAHKSASSGLDFPDTIVKVRWPEIEPASYREPLPERDSNELAPPMANFNTPEMPDGFELSSLEEQMADVLERAVREAGIDVS